MTLILCYRCIRVRVVDVVVVAVKGPYHRVTIWAEWTTVQAVVVMIVQHYRCIRLRVVVVVVVVVVVEVVAVKGPYHRVTNWAEWAIVHTVTTVLY